MQVPGLNGPRQRFTAPAGAAGQYTALNFLAACERPEVETRCRKNRATDCSLSPLLTLIVHRHPFRRRKGELSCVDGAVLLRFQLIAAALIILLDGAELMDSAVPTDVDRELLEVAAAAFGVSTKSSPFCLILYCCQSLDWLRAISINGVLLVASFSRRRGLLDERVIEPQRFTIRNEDALIRLGHMPVKQVRAFHPQVSLPVLHGVTAAVGDFCVKLAWKLLTLSRRLLSRWPHLPRR